MNLSSENNVSQLLHQLDGLSIADSLKELTRLYPGQVTFSSSFSFEDQIITHEILSNQLTVKIFTLDTGRMFAETYSVWNSTNEQYGTKIKAYYPNQDTLQELVEERGPNSFYESVKNRKDCCFIRKVEPLKRALAENAIWITGLRAAHSPERHDLPMIEWDESNKIIKYHPILHWTTEGVKEYITKNHVPYNALHDKGFVSIGCAPCTRAITPGEDFRAGRWWWEDADKKECGLHVHEEPAAKN
ncbi:phosphoadenylyl-sulfate reductase [Ferruginibacter sp.]|uniref:phosphoadenylyl-sulfate reductase n=1 Tax=Ferruginibacter sp. TaxID=1940288 RepID=UPI002657CC27|nr:phosphoadenylyl-sulfate reductase [Ferruginibacter sp.]